MSEESGADGERVPEAARAEVVQSVLRALAEHGYVGLSTGAGRCHQHPRAAGARFAGREPRLASGMFLY